MGGPRDVGSEQFPEPVPGSGENKPVDPNPNRPSEDDQGSNTGAGNDPAS